MTLGANETAGGGRTGNKVLLAPGRRSGRVRARILSPAVSLTAGSQPQCKMENVRPLRREKSLKGSALGGATGKGKGPYVAAALPLISDSVPEAAGDQHNLDQSRVCSPAILRRGERSHIRASSGASFPF